MALTPDNEAALDRVRTEQWFALAIQRKQDTAELARAGLKAVILLNGGAIVSLFTILGHVDNLAIHQANLMFAFGSYVFGLCAGVFAILFGFLGSNTFWVHEVVEAERVYFISRGLDGAPVPGWQVTMGKIAWFLAIVLALSSLMAFALGSYSALHAVSLKASQSPAAATSPKAKPSDG